MCAVVPSGKRKLWCLKLIEKILASLQEHTAEGLINQTKLNIYGNINRLGL
jgi:hypothetical protein